MAMGTCSSCGARIIWGKRADGRAHPLEPVMSRGNIRMVDGLIKIGPPGSGPYQSHFATCSQAEQWRRGRRPGGGEAA